jgi:hypothetical protein
MTTGNWVLRRVEWLEDGGGGNERLDTCTRLSIALLEFPRCDTKSLVTLA